MLSNIVFTKTLKKKLFLKYFLRFLDIRFTCTCYALDDLN